MTRTQKANDRDHQGLADGTAAPHQYLPKYFAKSGYADADPKKTKKNGGGKGNWGGAGEEVVDQTFNFANPRRRSNSSGYSNNLRDFKTKFDINEQEPVFEESIHGPEEVDEGEELTKTETASSGRSSSMDDEKVQKH